MMGLKFDYESFYLLPTKKREKFYKVAEQIEKTKLQQAEQLGPLAFFLGLGM